MAEYEQQTLSFGHSDETVVGVEVWDSNPPFEQLTLFDLYQYCMECRFIYWTAYQLVQSYMDNAPDDVHVKSIPAEQIHFCPECLHDFPFTTSYVQEVL